MVSTRRVSITGGGLLAATAVLAAPQAQEGLQSLDHIVLFMQENRAFDTYFSKSIGNGDSVTGARGQVWRQSF